MIKRSLIRAKSAGAVQYIKRTNEKLYVKCSFFARQAKHHKYCCGVYRPAYETPLSSSSSSSRLFCSPPAGQLERVRAGWPGAVRAVPLQRLSRHGDRYRRPREASRRSCRPDRCMLDVPMKSGVALVNNAMVWNPISGDRSTIYAATILHTQHPTLLVFHCTRCMCMHTACSQTSDKLYLCIYVTYGYSSNSIR